MIIDVDLYDSVLTEPISLIGRKRFAFISVFKLEDRKGWQELISAFYHAFTSSDDVSLHIHASDALSGQFDGGAVSTRIKAYLNTQFGQYPSWNTNGPYWNVIGRFLPASELRRVYTAADCFVLPSRVCFLANRSRCFVISH
jgi:glycosyltransferase involved in cell wall biosynthesis